MKKAGLVLLAVTFFAFAGCGSDHDFAVSDQQSGCCVGRADGDVNCDGVVSKEDTQIALDIAAGVRTPTACEMQHGDVAPLVDGAPQPDGKIDIGDVTVIARKADGLVSWPTET